MDNQLFFTTYFGSIPYYQEMCKHPSVKIDLFERYKKQSWRNRARILESNGPMYLTIPVTRPNGKETLIKDVLISEAEDWRKDHWKAIESSYQHAPFFFYYGPQIKELIYQKEPILYRFNHTIHQQISKWLDLEISVSFTEAYISPANKLDSRIALDKKQFDIKQERYIQVFSDKYSFFPNLSIMDLLLNVGPLSRRYILT